MKYDPNKQPDKDKWLAIPESERFVPVIAYHRRKRIKIPNETIHATIHVIVENQAALGDEYPVEAKINQLMEEGLNRHDAVHAVGSVLAEHLYGMLSDDTGIEDIEAEVLGNGPNQDLNHAYLEDLKHLTAASWLEKYSE